MQRIDIEDILYRRTGRHLPRPAAALLRRLIHERELNGILAGGGSLPPKEFIDHVLRSIGIEYSVVRTADIPSGDRYIFAANHPFGGPDGMIVTRTLMGGFKNVGVIVNDMLSNIEPLRPLWIPVNKYGRQNAATQLAYDEALASPTKQIFTFPAGFCSRIVGGRVADTEWKVRFVRDARRYDRRIVPVYVDGRLSKHFYAIYLLMGRKTKCTNKQEYKRDTTVKLSDSYEDTTKFRRANEMCICLYFACILHGRLRR